MYEVREGDQVVLTTDSINTVSQYIVAEGFHFVTDVLGAGTVQCFWRPGIPLDRIMGMLKEIRAGFTGKGIGVFVFRHE